MTTKPSIRIGQLIKKYKSETIDKSIRDYESLSDDIKFKLVSDVMRAYANIDHLRIFEKDGKEDFVLNGLIKVIETKGMDAAVNKELIDSIIAVYVKGHEGSRAGFADEITVGLYNFLTDAEKFI
jgi:hypothetical protein